MESPGSSTAPVEDAATTIHTSHSPTSSSIPAATLAVVALALAIGSSEMPVRARATTTATDHATADGLGQEVEPGLIQMPLADVHEQTKPVCNILTFNLL